MTGDAERELMARAWEASGLGASLADADAIREACLFRDDPSSPAIPILDPDADLFPDAGLLGSPGAPSGITTEINKNIQK